MESESESKTLDDIHKIIKALSKSDDEAVKRILEDAFTSNE